MRHIALEHVARVELPVSRWEHTTQTNMPTQCCRCIPKRFALRMHASHLSRAHITDSTLIDAHLRPSHNAAIDTPRESKRLALKLRPYASTRTNRWCRTAICSAGVASIFLRIACLASHAAIRGLRGPWSHGVIPHSSCPAPISMGSHGNESGARGDPAACPPRNAIVVAALVAAMLEPSASTNTASNASSAGIAVPRAASMWPLHKFDRAQRRLDSAMFPNYLRGTTVKGNVFASAQINVRCGRQILKLPADVLCVGPQSSRAP
jgi:hypothetical protein